MDKHLIEINIPEKFRAINKADIWLDGITVVSGINGCGKSTISKLLYQTYKYSIQYNRLITSDVNEKLKPYYDVLNQLYTIILIHKRQSPPFGTRRWRYLKNLERSEEYLHEVEELCHNFLEEERRTIEEYDDSLMTERTWRIIWSSLDNEGDKDLASNFDRLYAQMSAIIKEAQLLSQERPSSILKNKIASSLRNELPSTIEVSEYGDPFIGLNAKSVALPHYIQHVLYLDTPMMYGIDAYNCPENWDELNTYLKEPLSGNYGGIIRDTIQKEILHGEAIYDDESIDDDITFKREDGKVFSLFDCATGVKSFSILQLLYKNGYLKKDTLLIVDEPEAHLHPQWIVEYARLILLLHKEIGVKFFIASHSTDMVGALKEIAPTLDVKDLNFYVAEEAGDYTYNYRYLADDVEAIFASFNKSYEKLDYFVSHGKNK